MNEDGYRKWSNSETWEVLLWLFSTTRNYQMVRKWSKKAWRQAPRDRMVTEWKWERKAAAVYGLAGQIRQFVDEHNPIQQTPLYAALLREALREVDYVQIAEHYLNRVMYEGTAMYAVNKEHTHRSPHEPTRK